MKCKTHYKNKILQEDIIMCHFSFVGSDDRILNKIQHFSHAHDMDGSWFDEVWKRWTPDMENLHPHKGRGYVFKKAIRFNDCPEEIINHFNNII